MSSDFYRSTAWRRLRAACLARDPTCSTRGCGRPSAHADHIVPRANGGADVLDNLRGLCTSCHNSRSASGNLEPRAKGCDASGQPRDPRHAWNTATALGPMTSPGTAEAIQRAPQDRQQGGKLGEGDRGSKDGHLGGRDRGGSRTRTKFATDGF